ncbi:MAG: N-acetylgalactosamine-6-sulfatase [Planctomycetota bacterium]|nr:MAG: N-acetylgalactosamine-6-sulfatase [Planctomycetota bacterium]
MILRARTIVAAWFGAGLLTLGACGDTSAPREEPEGLRGALAGQDCVVILLDALRADALGSYGAEPSPSPALDRLASNGVRMSQAISQASWTLPSTTSLFTGLYQETHGLQFSVGIKPLKLVGAAVTLAELFADAGYATHSFTQNTFASDAYGLDQGFESFNMVNYFVDDGDAMARQVRELLDEPSERPRFVYAHFRRPHTPYDPPAEFLNDAVGAGQEIDREAESLGTDARISQHNSGKLRFTPGEHARHLELYRANIRATDAHLADLLAGLQAAGTLVVVLSDHGEAFGEHERYGHNWLSYQEYVHIPWLMSHPELPRGAVFDEPVMTVDVLPTLAELFALEADSLAVHGSSLVPLLEGGAAPRRAAVFSSSRVAGNGRQQLTAFDGRYKLLRDLPGGREWLFDLQADPGELTDVTAEHAELAARLSALLTDWVSSQHASLASESGELSAESLENLRALGYLGDDVGG